MCMRTHHVCGQCVCAHITCVVNAYAHTLHVLSMHMRTHRMCGQCVCAHITCGQCVCAHITCVVNAYAHAPHVWSMRMRTHHVVTIYSRKPINVIAIVLVLQYYRSALLCIHVRVCLCMYILYVLYCRRVDGLMKRRVLQEH